MSLYNRAKGKNGKRKGNRENVENSSALPVHGATVLPGLVAEKRKNGGKEPERDKYPDKSRGTGAENQFPDAVHGEIRRGSAECGNLQTVRRNRRRRVLHPDAGSAGNPKHPAKRHV